MWFQTLQFYTQSLGGWRKRRKGLANIMVDPKVLIWLNSDAAASKKTLLACLLLFGFETQAPTLSTRVPSVTGLTFRSKTSNVG